MQIFKNLLDVDLIPDVLQLYKQSVNQVTVDGITSERYSVSHNRGLVLLSKYNGIYISHKDENSLLNALTIIFNDWDIYSKNAITTFKRNYSIKNIDKYTQIIKNNYLA